MTDRVFFFFSSDFHFFYTKHAIIVAEKSLHIMKGKYLEDICEIVFILFSFPNEM